METNERCEERTKMKLKITDMRRVTPERLRGSYRHNKEIYILLCFFLKNANYVSK